MVVEIFSVRRIDLCGDTHRHLCTLRDFDGAVGALLDRNTAKKGKVILRLGAELQEIVG